MAEEGDTGFDDDEDEPDDDDEHLPKGTPIPPSASEQLLPIWTCQFCFIWW